MYVCSQDRQFIQAAHEQLKQPDYIADNHHHNTGIKEDYLSGSCLASDPNNGSPVNFSVNHLLQAKDLSAGRTAYCSNMLSNTLVGGGTMMPPGVQDNNNHSKLAGELGGLHHTHLPHHGSPDHYTEDMHHDRHTGQYTLRIHLSSNVLFYFIQLLGY